MTFHLQKQCIILQYSKMNTTIDFPLYQSKSSHCLVPHVLAVYAALRIHHTHIEAKVLQEIDVGYMILSVTT